MTLTFSMSNHAKKLICSFLFILSSSVYALNGHFYLSGTAGPSFEEIGNSHPKITYLDGSLTDAYPISSNTATTAMIGASGGYEFACKGYRPAIALGLGVYSLPWYTAYNGQLVETALDDPSTPLYNTKFHVNTTRLMLETQFTWMVRQFTPFINVGIGSAWNKFSKYSENAVNPIINYAVQPPFHSQTNTNFAYQVGVGIGYAFNFKPCQSVDNHERIALGYRYANLGDISSGIRDDSYPFHLDTGHLSTNEVYLTYTHLF